MQLSPANSGQTSYDAFSDFAGLVLGDLQNRVVLAEQNQDRLVQDISQKIDGLKGFLEASVKNSCLAIAKKLDEENKNALGNIPSPLSSTFLHNPELDIYG